VFDPYGNYVYTALTNKWQTGFKIDRNDRVSLTYQRSGLPFPIFMGSSVTVSIRDCSWTGITGFMIGRKKIMNTLTISRQEMSIPFTAGGS